MGLRGWAGPCHAGHPSSHWRFCTTSQPHPLMHCPSPGRTVPWEVGTEVCGSDQGQRLPLSCLSPVSRSPDPKVPGRVHLTPKLSAATRVLDGEWRPGKGNERSALNSGSLTGPQPSSPWPCVTQPPPLSPCLELQPELSWVVAMRRKGRCPSGQGHREWPQQAAYLARDLRLTLR